jgi:hypothetical protein
MEEQTKNQEVRAMCYNIPNMDTFINKRVAKYQGKTARSSDTILPKKFLAAWINKGRKTGGPQVTCNNNFAKVIKNILPAECTLTNSNAPIKECPPHLAKDEPTWLHYIEEYFESCQKTDESFDSSIEEEEGISNSTER